MKRVLAALEQLAAEHVIEDYAIGGAIGAAFYIKAAETEDIDAFVIVPGKVSGLALLTPIYDALTAMGGVVEREYIRFGDWPLQILTDANPLIAEAIRNAVATSFDGVSTRIFGPEYLCAIALQVGRAKDILRVSMFLEQGAVNRELLVEILSRFGLAIPPSLSTQAGGLHGDR